MLSTIPAPAPALKLPTEGDYALLARAFRRALLAENLSPRSVSTYLEGVTQFGQFLAAQRMPLVVAHITREHIDEYLAAVLATHRSATAETRYRGLSRFFKWVFDEGEIERSPMERIRPPHIVQEATPILSDDELRRLLHACEGKDFLARRDMALIRLLIDTGMRLAECVNLSVDDVDLEQGVAVVLGKGRRPRWCPFANKASRALFRYSRVRADHPHANSQAFWLGSRGRLGVGGVHYMLRQRAEQAGIGPIHAHQFRHSFAHCWLAAGLQENDLMRLLGWRSRTMLGRYAASAADERAHAAYRQHNLGDRL